MLKDKHYYVFKKSLDAYFCMDGRVQIEKDAIIQYHEFTVELHPKLHYEFESYALYGIAYD